MNLNIGSGMFPPPNDWLNVDLHPAEEHGGWPYALDDTHPHHRWQIDIVCDCRDMPIEDGTVTHIFYGHTLEHLSYDVEAPEALREAWRVLRTGGELGVVGPAMDLAMSQPQWSEDEHLIHAIGGDAHDHLWEATSENTLALVQLVFPNARIVPVTDVCLNTGWPCTNAGVASWQVAILASKDG